MSEHSLENVPLTGQDRLYVEFSSQAIQSALSQLSSLDLQLLRIVGEAGTIGTKALALETHLSRSAALSHAKKLTQSNLLIRKSAPSKTSGIKPTYFFSLAPDLTIEAIEAAIIETEPPKPLSTIEEQQSKEGTDDSNVVAVLDTAKTPHQGNALIASDTAELSPQSVESTSNPATFEEKVWKVLTQMTKQIAELKSRIAEIENEKRSAERFDEDALLRMMESDES